MKKFFSILLSLFIFSNLCYAYSDSYTVRDKYGRKVSTYTTSGNTTVERDKYGRKTATFRKSSNGTITKYDKYGRRIGTIKED